jgi:hypothetical protein
MNGTATTSAPTTPPFDVLVDSPCPNWCVMDHADPTINPYLREAHRGHEMRITIPGGDPGSPLAVAAVTEGECGPYVDVWSSVTDGQLDARQARILAVRYRQFAAHLDRLAGDLG